MISYTVIIQVSIGSQVSRSLPGLLGPAVVELARDPWGLGRSHLHSDRMKPDNLRKEHATKQPTQAGHTILVHPANTGRFNHHADILSIKITLLKGWIYQEAKKCPEIVRVMFYYFTDT